MVVRTLTKAPNVEIPWDITIYKHAEIFGYIKKTHAGYLVFVKIIKPIIDDAMQSCLRGMAF